MTVTLQTIKEARNVIKDWRDKLDEAEKLLKGQRTSFKYEDLARIIHERTSGSLVGA